MSSSALPWFFEDQEARDLARWSIAAAITVGIHVALVCAYLLWPQPEAVIGDNTPVVSIDIVAPEVDQVEQAPVEKPTPPEETAPDAAVPQEKPPEKVEQANPAPRTSVHADASAPRIDVSWQALLLRRLQQFKNYPRAARERGEQGVALLGFSVDRDGRVTDRKIVRSSGHADLDNEVLAMVERAQPLPAFPPSMSEPQLSLTVPIRFSLH